MWKNVYFRRKIDAFLNDWKADPFHKPLIVKGARQIGNKDVYIHNLSKWVHYDNDGWMVYGPEWHGPQFYYWDIYRSYDEILSTNYVHEYYFDPVTGEMAHGWITVDGQLRHYNEVTGIRES